MESYNVSPYMSCLFYISCIFKVHPFHGWGIFHCMDNQHFSLFVHQVMYITTVSSFGYYEWCYYKHPHVSFYVGIYFYFSWGRCYFSWSGTDIGSYDNYMFKKLPNCFLNSLKFYILTSNIWESMCLPTIDTASLFDVIHFSVHVMVLIFPNESLSFHVFTIQISSLIK